MIDDLDVRLETGLRCFLRVRLQEIDTADAVEDVELQARIVLEETAYLDQVGGVHDDERIDGVELLGFDAAAELLFENADDVCGGHGGGSWFSRELLRALIASARRSSRLNEYIALAGAAISLFLRAKAFCFSTALTGSGSLSSGGSSV